MVTSSQTGGYACLIPSYKRLFPTPVTTTLKASLSPHQAHWKASTAYKSRLFHLSFNKQQESKVGIVWWTASRILASIFAPSNTVYSACLCVVQVCYAYRLTLANYQSIQPETAHPRHTPMFHSGCRSDFPHSHPFHHATNSLLHFYLVPSSHRISSECVSR